MNPNLTYEQAVDALRIHYDTTDLISSRPQSHLMVAANLQTFLPNVPAADYDHFFADILYYQHLAGMDEKIVTKAAELVITGDADGLWDAAAGKPTIFCTCHLGSYRLLGLLLTRLGLKFSLLIDTNTFQKQGEKFMRIHREAAALFNQPNADMTLIDAEQPSAGIQLIRALKQGRILIAYLDGNTGAGGVTRQDDKLVGVDFLGKPLLARKGIAFLSVATQAPIVPIFAYRPDAYTNAVQVFTPITPTETSAAEREAVCASITQRLYDDFATTLRQYPSQWEGWLYVQKYLDLNRLRATYPATTAPAIADKTDWFFNHTRYANVPDGNTAVLFDKHLYRSFRVTRQLGELLNAPSVRLEAIRKPELIDMLVGQAIVC
ncbi:hypothetical protein ACAW74_22685 [Fibrella sp. WM1]|uniref:LpxL/LpxP family acyltransferase n=1 Tax=Fibrella musci TaxID=3242485 RepID=UPI00351FDA17